VCKLTPVQPGDFDAKAIRLLDALNEKGRALEARTFPEKLHENMMNMFEHPVFSRTEF
jgi:hypothetical protein